MKKEINDNKDIEKAEDTENKEDIEKEQHEKTEEPVKEKIVPAADEKKEAAKPIGKENFFKKRREKEVFDKEAWKPKTDLGRKVKSGEIKDIGEILDKGCRILESAIVEVLLPELESDLLMIGQSKGKFGGGQRRVFKQTQKKTQEGNKPHFSTLAVVGNKNGFVGIGYGTSKETVPAREKALRKAKLNIIKVRRGNGSWESDSTEPTSIPFAVEGRCSGVKIKLFPAPKGTGLSIEPECAKMLELAGIKDIRSKTLSRRKTKINIIKACFYALKQLSKIKLTDEQKALVGVVEGKISPEKDQEIQDEASQKQIMETVAEE